MVADDATTTVDPDWRALAKGDGYIAEEVAQKKKRCTDDDISVKARRPATGTFTPVAPDCNLPPEKKRLAANGWGAYVPVVGNRVGNGAYKMQADASGLKIVYHASGPTTKALGEEVTRRIPCDFLIHPAVILTTGSGCEKEAKRLQKLVEQSTGESNDIFAKGRSMANVASNMMDKVSDIEVHDWAPEEGKAGADWADPSGVGEAAFNAVFESLPGADENKLKKYGLAVGCAAAMGVAFSAAGAALVVGSVSLWTGAVFPTIGFGDKSVSAIFGHKYVIFPCAKAMTSIASSAFASDKVAQIKVRDAEFDAQIRFGQTTVDELKAFLAKYHFLKDPNLENSRVFVEKALARVNCAVVQLESFSTTFTTVSETQEEARADDESKAIGIFRQFNEELYYAAQQLHMHVSAIGTEASVATQKAVEEGLPQVLAKIEEVKNVVDTIKTQTDTISTTAEILQKAEGRFQGLAEKIKAVEGTIH